MVKLGISIKSSTNLIRRLLNTMTSQQEYGISNSTCSLCQCRKSPFTRTISSGSTDSGQRKVTVESRDCRSTEREGLQWDKLSEDEKNIYLAHKNACMVSKAHNRPFTVVCSVTWPLNGSEAGGALFCCCVNQTLMLIRCIYLTKAERSVSKQSHLQPHCYSKVRLLRREL